MSPILLALPVLFGAVAPLRGQDGEATIITVGDKGIPRTRADYHAALQATRSGHLLVVEPARGMIAPTLKALLAQDPLADLEVPLLVLPLEDTGLGRDLAKAFNWEGPRWAYVDRDGRVRLDGQALPTASALAEQLLGTGYTDRSRELEAFLRTHPEHLEAMDQLLALKLRSADRHMRPLLKTVSKAMGTEPEPVVPDLQGPMSDADDQRLWGRAANLLDRLLASGHGLQGKMAWLEAFPKTARHSPLMRSVALRVRQGVEEAVLRTPSDFRPWQAWVHLSATAGRLDLDRVMAQVAGVPSDPPEALPPVVALESYVQECRGAGAWLVLRKSALPVVEAQAIFHARVAEAYGERFRMDAIGPMSLVTALLEAQLRLGEEAEAKARVQEAVQSKAFGVVMSGVQAARQAGREDLASQWAPLAQGGGK